MARRFVLQAREERVDALEIGADLGAARAAAERAGDQVLLDGQRAEAVAALEDLDEAAARRARRG